MFVLMLRGHPITAKLPEDLGFGQRFWYWLGSSGQSYIHSIYSVESCPPLPGAVFIAVRRRGTRREPLLVGRFSESWDGQSSARRCLSADHGNVDEIHVHLIARSEAAAELVLHDLQAALAESPAGCGAGLQEAAQGELALV